MDMNKEKISAGEDLIKQLRYDSETGQLFWTRKRANNIDLTKPAGSVNGKGYVNIGITVDSGKKWSFKAHTLVWRVVTGTWPDKQLDHVNRNRVDNRIENLRLVTDQENKMNKGVQINNALGLQNIVMHGNSYRVQVMLYGKFITSKTFRTLEQAIAHRDAIRLQYGFSPATDRLVAAQ